MITDISADTSVVMGKMPYGVDEVVMVDTFKELLAENEANQRASGKNISFSLLGASAQENKDRADYYDVEITFGVKCSYQSQLDSRVNFSTGKISKVLALGERPLSLTGGPNERDRAILQRALSEIVLDPEDGGTDSIRFKSIQKGAQMLHWTYSREYRWSWRKTAAGGYFGMRDCSSFVYTSYQDYCTFFDRSDASTTQTIYSQAQKYGLLNTWNYKDVDKIDEILKPGDIILTTGNPERRLNIGHTGIYLGDGYVMHAVGGIDGILITRPSYFSKKPTPTNHGCLFWIRIPESMARPGSNLMDTIYNYDCRK